MKLNPDDFRPKLVRGRRVASPEYHSWQNMKNRCTNPAAQDWAYYGGRGIGVCRPWLSFDNFIRDMGPKPFAGATLERKNGEWGYFSQNCCWASRQTQSRNRDYCKLTPQDATDIRHKYFMGDGARQVGLAKEYGVTQAHISAIIRGAVWKL